MIALAGQGQAVQILLTSKKPDNQAFEAAGLSFFDMQADAMKQTDFDNKTKRGGD